MSDIPSNPSKGIDWVMSILAQRYPMLMIDRALEVDPGKKAVVLKNVTANEPDMPGHYPEPKPMVMAGSKQIEAASQAVAIMRLSAGVEPGVATALAGVDGFKFLRPIVPGDQLIITAVFERMKMGIVKSAVEGKVGDKVAFKGVIFGATLSVEQTTGTTEP